MNGISVIITFYNGISSLEQCVSIVKTSLINEKNQEILIVNDNPEIRLESIAEKYEVKLINMPRNMGYAGACNRAVPSAQYDTLLFMDCDIYPSEDWFEHMKNTYHDIDEKGAYLLLFMKQIREIFLVMVWQFTKLIFFYFFVMVSQHNFLKRQRLPYSFFRLHDDEQSPLSGTWRPGRIMHEYSL